MAFNCIRSFDIVSDATFIQLPKLLPTSNTNQLTRVSEKSSASKIFHTYDDLEKQYK